MVGIDLGDEKKTGPAIAALPVVKKIDVETPLLTAEVMPSYPGGLEALKRFLERNLNNPQDLQEGQMVSVKIRFIVGYDGKLKGFETVEDGGEAFNKEVIRVLKKMKDWIPGKSNGENVSVYYIIPVKFVEAN
jgi:protein TonB